MSAELEQRKREEKNNEAKLAELRSQIEMLEVQLVSPEDLHEVEVIKSAVTKEFLQFL